MIPLIYEQMMTDMTYWHVGGPPVLLLSVGAFIVSFLFVFFSGRITAARLYRAGIRDRVRNYDAFFAKSKTGTPTMGGILIVGAICAGGLMFCDLSRGTSGLLLLTAIWFGAIGALDDALKVRRGSSDGGLSRGVKFLLQIAFGVFFALILVSDGCSPFPEEIRTRLIFPFPADFWIDLGVVYPLFIVFVVVAVANAINFADGLDGLAVLPSGLSAAVFAFFAYLAWNGTSANFFGFEAIYGIQDVVVFSSAVVGACFGFLWFNGYPAQMFMGDTGSQALGGSLAAIAILSKQELLFVVAGGIFVFEAFSVFLQDYIGIRFVGRRFFYRAPAHHSYQHQGVAETKVVLRFWIASILCAVLSVATLKLR